MIIELSLTKQPVLVVGAGSVGLRRAEKLAEQGAEVFLLAPNATPDERFHVMARAFNDSDVKGKALVVAATDDDQLNHHIAQLCQRLGVPVNTADRSQGGNVRFLASYQKPPFDIAIGSKGLSPSVLKVLQERFAIMLPPPFAQLARLVGEYRQKVRYTLSSSKQRGAFWRRAMGSRVVEYLFVHRPEKARQELDSWLANGGAPQVGEAYLIGAGPGDPELMTLRGIRLLQQADVILYDRLVADAILRMGRSDAEYIYVGKKQSDHHVPQEGINELIVRHAQAGKRVARLKGGDPYIFGRGGEEMQEIVKAGIPFQVVPGISAAQGVASYAGIPLTHRDYAHSVRFITAHRRPGMGIDWHNLVQDGQTLVFYMGLTSAQDIANGLQGAGLASDTPVGVVSQATTTRQQKLISTLAEFAKPAQLLESPALIIVGGVVELSTQLDWFSELIND
ncbi:siroheme synthase CysG [Salinibius halmophilus]|uniref:siroheme synthase CysG n=1 Tax=Salinibius halmophilus TaxID=1853216 RepID=UPI000E669001|nr:siroheme synthase CysG [Salinibius halmophilus]